MIWHKCFNGDFPEDHIELVNAERVIRVLTIDSSGEYSIQLREYVPGFDGYIWHSKQRNIIAWTQIDPYKE